MPVAAELSESEQNDLLLGIYALAQHHAERLVRAQNRDDLVQTLALRWLRRLRAGVWDEPRENWNAFVIRAILNQKSEDRRQRRRSMARDAVYLEALTNALREWMSPEFQLEEKELRAFAEQIHDTLPRRCVRAHRLVREDGLSYAEVGKRLRVPAARVHDYIKTVHRAFRRALPSVDVAPPASRRGPRPPRARRRPLNVRRNRRPANASRGAEANTPRPVV